MRDKIRFAVILANLVVAIYNGSTGVYLHDAYYLCLALCNLLVATMMRIEMSIEKGGSR